MIAGMPRLSSVSEREFHDHYRHPHGTLALTIRLVKAYVQSHRVHSDLLNEEQAYFEGCAEVWFDSIADVQSLPEDPDYRRYLAPDEPLFIDMERVAFHFLDEEIVESCASTAHHARDEDVIWRPDRLPTSAKLIQFVQEDGKLRWDGEDDLELGRRLGALRHVRCRPISALHPEGSFAIGIRELWWPTLSALEAGVEQDRDAWDALIGRPSRSIAMVALAERFL